MKFKKTAILFVITASLFTAPGVDATLIPNPDGLRVYDTYLKVNWLADANLPHTQSLPNNEPFDGTLGFPICDKNIFTNCI